MGPSASPFRLPGLLRIRNMSCYKPLHYISSSNRKDAVLLCHCTGGERHALFWPVSDVLPQQAPQPEVLVNLVPGISHVPLALLGNSSGSHMLSALLGNSSRSQVCPGGAKPHGGMACNAPAQLLASLAPPPAPALPWPCFWGPGHGHSLPLLCLQAFRISHDPFVFPTVCALTLVFFPNCFFLAHCYCSSVQYFKIVFLLACFFLFFFFS